MAPQRCKPLRNLTILILINSLAALPLISANAAAADKRAPNIIFILADDLGYGELGCYGLKKFETPSIDKLAATGMRFTQCYAGCSVCAPSRSTLMTGLHTGHTPIRQNSGGNSLAAADVTLAKLLKKAGYKTGCFGKWGLGIENTPGHPNRQGFDEFFGYLHQVHAHFYYPYFLWKNETRFGLENEGRRRQRYAHDEIMARALNFIKDNKDGPFFCYLPVTIPHVELVVPEDSLKPFMGRWPEKPLPDPRQGYIGADKPLAAFAGMVSRLDRDVGRILKLLEELKIDEQTIVIFTSDNGGQGGPWQRVTDFFDGNGGLRGYKGSFYEGGIRVPLLVRWPRHIRPGTESGHVCAFWDMLPTLLQLAGAEIPSKTDGISFVPTLLNNAEQKEHAYLYWELGKARALRLGDLKMVQPTPDQAMQVFDLKVDPGERTQLSPDQFTLRRLKLLLAEAHREPRPLPPDPRKTIDDFVR